MKPRVPMKPSPRAADPVPPHRECRSTESWSAPKAPGDLRKSSATDARAAPLEHVEGSCSLGEGETESAAELGGATNVGDENEGGQSIEMNITGKI